MIENFEWIDKNVDGDKVRLTGTTVQLYNKLSADEANLLRDKVNETVTVLNLLSPPLFPLFSLKFKGEGNLNSQLLEPGDIVHGFYDADTIWDNAEYLGGDPTDKANYENQPSTGVFMPKIQFVADGAQTDFDIGVPARVTAVFWDGALLNDDDWDAVDGVITLTFVPALGALIKPI